MSKDDSDDGSDLRRALFTVSDAVLGAAVLLVVGVYGGRWLDQQFHTAPWLSVGLALLGGGFGLARMVVKANSLQIKSSSSRKSEAVKEPSSDKTPAPEPSDPSQPRNPFDDY